VAILAVVPAAALGGGARGRIGARRRAARPPLALPLAIGARPAVAWLGLVLVLTMTAAAAWVVARGPAGAAGIFGMLVFGAGSLVLARAALRPGPHVVLREEGIDDRRLGVVIPWSEVEGASLSRVHPIEYVRFAIRDPGRYLANVPPPSLPLSLLLGGAKPQPKEIGVPATGTPYSGEEICELIRAEVRRRRRSSG
jgi:hypothetical protein